MTGLGTPGSHGGTCAYNGQPGVFPGATGSENVTLTAPAASGTYDVVANSFWDWDCAGALADYGYSGYRQSIGQIIVP